MPGSGRFVTVVAMLAVAACSKSAPAGHHDGGDGGAGADGDAAVESVDARAHADGAVMPFPADQTSGTRLRARMWVTADGARLVDRVDGPTWFDTTLKTPCRLGTNGGAITCAPIAPFVADGDLFGDSSCTTTPLARGPTPSSSLPGLPPSWHDAFCGSQRYATWNTDLYEVAAPPAGLTVYAKSQGCQPVTPPAGGGFPLGRKVDPSEYAVAHVEVVDTGHRLSAIQYVTDDGARQRVGWHDNILGVDCSVGFAKDGKARCLPLSSGSAATDDEWADAACTQALVTASVPTGGGPAFVTNSDNLDDCKVSMVQVFHLGAAFQGQPYYGVSGACSQPDAGAVMPGTFILGDELQPDAMDLFEDVPSTTRIATAVRRDPDGALDISPFGAPSGAVALGTQLMDTALHQYCRFQHTADGKVQCVPWWANQVPGVNCMRQIALVLAGPADGMLPPPCEIPETVTATWTGDECTGGLSISALGSAILPNGGAVGECLVTVSLPTVSYFEIGAAVPAGTYEAATLVTE